VELKVGASREMGSGNPQDVEVTLADNIICCDPEMTAATYKIFEGCHLHLVGLPPLWCKCKAEWGLKKALSPTSDFFRRREIALVRSHHHKPSQSAGSYIVVKLVGSILLMRRCRLASFAITDPNWALIAQPTGSGH
jgi:hypothetical protein